MTTLPIQPVVHSTFTLERSYKAAPERVFQAWADGQIRKRWFAPDTTNTIEHFEQDFRVGGTDRLSYRFGEGSPFPGVVITNRGVYFEITPNRRIVSAHSMDMDGRVFSASLTTVELEAAGGGTRLRFTHQGAFLEGSDGPTMREEGWNKLLDALARELGH
jgi:uncharacterized protein YndB with AHSA1/START domain